MDYIKIGNLKVSRFIIGGNTFSGFSHQGVETDREMIRYYTCERIKETLAEAERLGVNTFIGRTDNHIIRVLLEYWDQGGKIQWFAQTAPEYGEPMTSVKRAIQWGAKACYIHGGVMDHLFTHNRLDEVKEPVKAIKDAGLAVAMAAHRPEVFGWAEDNLDVDFYMCAYYDPFSREVQPEHIPGQKEQFDEKMRQAMTGIIAQLRRPVVHYKILAAGRNEPKEAFAYAAKYMKNDDAVCVGVYTKEFPGMLEEDVRLLEESLAEK